MLSFFTFAFVLSNCGGKVIDFEEMIIKLHPYFQFSLKLTFFATHIKQIFDFSTKINQSQRHFQTSCKKHRAGVRDDIAYRTRMTDTTYLHEIIGWMCLSACVYVQVNCTVQKLYENTLHHFIFFNKYYGEVSNLPEKSWKFVCVFSLKNSLMEIYHGTLSVFKHSL